jgi:hypothetical protein
MNIPDGAVWSMGGTAALFVVWSLKSLSDQRYRANKAEDDSNERQKRRDQIESRYQDRQDDRDEQDAQHPNSFLSVRDWQLVIAEIAKMLRSETNELRADLAIQRSEDKDELRAWINGSFMRSGVVDAKIDAIVDRVDRLESRKPPC